MSHGPPAPEERGLPDAGVTTEPQQPPTPPLPSCCQNWASHFAPLAASIEGCSRLTCHLITVHKFFRAFSLFPLTPPPLQTSFVGTSLSHAAGWRSPLPGFWQQHQQVVGKGPPASNVTLSVSSLHPSVFLSATVAAAATPTGKKEGGGGGVRWKLPLFLTLIRKPSLLLCGE